MVFNASFLEANRKQVGNIQAIQKKKKHLQKTCPLPRRWDNFPLPQQAKDLLSSLACHWVRRLKCQHALEEYLPWLSKHRIHLPVHFRQEKIREKKHWQSHITVNYSRFYSLPLILNTLTTNSPQAPGSVLPPEWTSTVRKSCDVLHMVWRGSHWKNLQKKTNNQVVRLMGS